MFEGCGSLARSRGCLQDDLPYRRPQQRQIDARRDRTHPAATPRPGDAHDRRRLPCLQIGSWARQTPACMTPAAGPSAKRLDEINESAVLAADLGHAEINAQRLANVWPRAEPAAPPRSFGLTDSVASAPALRLPSLRVSRQERTPVTARTLAPARAGRPSSRPRAAVPLDTKEPQSRGLPKRGHHGRNDDRHDHPERQGQPRGKLADAELHFTHGSRSGLN
jgi:hypothetical protein